MPIELNLIVSLILILIHLCVWWISKWSVLPIVCMFNPKHTVLEVWIAHDLHKTFLLLLCAGSILSLDWRFV